jgi:hypothetical protein
MMKIKRLAQDHSVPLILLLVTLVTYGLFIPWLGFYWDDWPVLMMYKFFGTGAYADFYTYDRPFSFWTYLVTIPVLGLRPLAWQLFGILLRWLTALFIWLSLRLLWPDRKREMTWIAILFLVYPVFSLQFISVAFSQHWICFLLYAISLWGMLKSWTAGRQWDGYYILSLVTAALHLWTMEYFLGMEMLRLILIWMVLLRFPSMSLRDRISRFIKWAWPYIVIIVVFAFWRLFILKLPEPDPNAIQFLADLRTQPLTGIINLVQIIARDLVYMFLRVWSDILDPGRIVITSKFFLFAVLIAVLAGLGIVFYLSRLPKEQEKTQAQYSTSRAQMLFIAFLAILLGILPGWITYREVLTIPYGSRIALPAQLGLSIFVVILIEWLVEKPAHRLLLFGILFGISVFSHLYTANYYREAWEGQRQFYWQLYWRVPGIRPQTAILSDSEVVPSAGTYSTAAALNMIYARQPVDLKDLPYWFFNMGHQFGRQYDRFISGKNISARFRNWGFRGDSENSLLVDYDGEGCVNVILPDPVENPLLPASLKDAVGNANPDRIMTGDAQASDLPSAILGSEPAHTWCYYFEKAELARQLGDWKKVISLGEQAQKLGFQPKKAIEWLPFVDAYVQDDQLAPALNLTNEAYLRDPRVQPQFCAYWQTLLIEQPLKFSSAQREAIQQMLQCDFK